MALRELYDSVIEINPDLQQVLVYDNNLIKLKALFSQFAGYKDGNFLIGERRYPSSRFFSKFIHSYSSIKDVLVTIGEKYRSIVAVYGRLRELFPSFDLNFSIITLPSFEDASGSFSFTIQNSQFGLQIMTTDKKGEYLIPGPRLKDRRYKVTIDTIGFLLLELLQGCDFFSKLLKKSLIDEYVQLPQSDNLLSRVISIVNQQTELLTDKYLNDFQ